MLTYEPGWLLTEAIVELSRRTYCSVYGEVLDGVRFKERSVAALATQILDNYRNWWYVSRLVWMINV